MNIKKIYVAPSTTSIPVNVVMEDDGQGGYRANVYITNNSTYNLSGTMSDFYINSEQQSATQTISNLTINSSINLYGTVAHQSMEHSQDWYVTLNLTDGISWTTPTTVGSAWWYGVTYGDSKFVAVGSSGYTTTSTDGITNWTLNYNGVLA